jgi:DNA-binding transcriptional MocR family regulator
MWRGFRGASGYADLVERIRSGIEAGELAHGARLPSHRDLAYDLGLATGTVTRAYQLAEREGLIVSYVGRGSFVASPAEIARGKRHHKDPNAEIDLSLDEPLEAFNPPIDAVLKSMADERGANTLCEYHNTGWAARHRAIAAGWIARFGFNVSPDNVIVCAGAQHAVLCSLATLCRPGDTVLVEELSYPGFRGVIEMLGLRAEAIKVDSHGIVPAAVEEACVKHSPRALYLTPSVQNPTNCQLNAARRARIAQLADRFDFAVIEDEVRPRSVLPAPAPIATLVPSRTFFIGGVSKTLGGGLRVAFLAAPERWRQSLPTAVWASIYVASPVTAEIASRLIESGQADKILEAKEQEAERRRALTEQYLGHLDIRTHVGSTTAWLPLPAGWTNAAAVTAVRDRGVSITPADAFWNGRSPPPDAVRLSIGAPQTAEMLKTALIRIADCLSSVRNPIRL